MRPSENIMLSVTIKKNCAECRYVGCHCAEYGGTNEGANAIKIISSRQLTCNKLTINVPLSYLDILMSKHHYTITIIHRLSISMKPSLLSLKHLVLAFNTLDTLTDIRIKAFTLLF